MNQEGAAGTQPIDFWEMQCLWGVYMILHGKLGSGGKGQLFSVCLMGTLGTPASQLRAQCPNPDVCQIPGFVDLRPKSLIS